MANENTESLRMRIRGLKTQHVTSQQKGLEKQAELIAGALEVEEAKLAKLISRCKRPS